MCPLHRRPSRVGVSSVSAHLAHALLLSSVGVLHVTFGSSAAAQVQRSAEVDFVMESDPSQLGEKAWEWGSERQVVDEETRRGGFSGFRFDVSGDPRAEIRTRLDEFRHRGRELVELAESESLVRMIRAGGWDEFLSEALRFQGYGQYFEGDLEGALESWRAAVERATLQGQAENIAKGYSSLGFGYRQAGDLLRARNQYEFALSHASPVERVSCRLNLANCQIELGNLTSAFEQLAQTLDEANDSQACIALYNLSAICGTAVLHEAAVRLAEASLERYELDPEGVERKAGKFVRTQIELHMAASLTALGRADDARVVLEKIEQRAQPGQTPTPWMQAEMALQYAAIAMERGRPQEVLTILDPYVVEAQRPGRPPNYVEPFVRRLQSHALCSLGRYREALEALDAVDLTLVPAGSYLEQDLDELQLRLWGLLAEGSRTSSADPATPVETLTSGTTAGGTLPQSRLPERVVVEERSREVQGQKYLRTAQSRALRVQFAHPSLIQFLGDLADRPRFEVGAPGSLGSVGMSDVGTTAGLDSARQALSSGGRGPIWALFVSLSLAISSFLLGLHARHRARRVARLERLVEELKLQRQQVALRAAAVSHDLRAPVLALRCALDLLGLDGKAANIERRVEPMRRGLDQIIKLADDSLLLSELSGAGLRAAGTACDMRDVVAEAVELWCPVAEQKGLQLRLISKAAPVYWWIEGVYGTRLIENLLSNATKFSNGPGVIEVLVEARGSRGVLSVRDCGPGLPAEDLHRFFEPMARLTSRPTGGESGSGLGTSIVRELTLAHEGQVAVRTNEVGTGLTVTLDWPLGGDRLNRVDSESPDCATTWVHGNSLDGSESAGAAPGLRGPRTHRRE